MKKKGVRIFGYRKCDVLTNLVYNSLIAFSAYWSPSWVISMSGQERRCPLVLVLVYAPNARIGSELIGYVQLLHVVVTG
jgi:hypothetical protein